MRDIIITQCDDMERETTITIRIESSLKAALEAACNANDETISRVLRKAAREYVVKNAQGDLLAVPAKGKRK